MFKRFNIKTAIFMPELHQIKRGQITGGVVEEHVLRARVGAADFTVLGAGVPGIDRVVVLDAGIGAGPGGVADLLPGEESIDSSDRNGDPISKSAKFSSNVPEAERTSSSSSASAEISRSLNLTRPS